MKPEERNFQAYLEDMIEAIEKILRYTLTLKDANDFLTNEMVIDAVTRNYEIIGEASNKIPQVVKERYPEVPWRQMYGLRNFAVHEYHIIDPILLWEIARDYLPANLEQLKQILEKEE
jgi:uncharacterized protein with HEPN domain